MDLVLQTNIFFYITSAAVLVVTFFVCVVLYYVVRILRDIRAVTDRVRRGSESVANDLASLREGIREDGMRLRDFAMFFVRRFGIMPTERPRKTKRAPKKEEVSE